MPKQKRTHTPVTALEHVKELIFDSTSLHQLFKGLQQDSRVEFVRAPGSLPAFVAAGIVARLGRQLLYIAPDITTAEQIRDDLRTLVDEENVVLLPARSAIPYDPLHQNPRFDERAGAFERLVAGDYQIIITIAQALVERVEKLTVHKERLVRFTEGDEIDREALALILTEAGMHREVRAEEPGQFALRGSVIDIYPPSSANPVRLDLWGDEITDIRFYDPVTQRSLGKTPELAFYAGEQQAAKREVGLWELLKKNTAVFVDDPDLLDTNLDRSWEEIEYQFDRRRELEKDVRTPRPDELYISTEEVKKALYARPVAIHRGPAAPTEGAINFDARNHDTYLGDLQRVIQHLNQQSIDGYNNVILCDREHQVERMEDMLEDQGYDLSGVRLTLGALTSGFVWPDARISVFTDHQIFGRHKRTRPYRHRKHRTDPTAFEKLQKGDFVVHTDFGVGRYIGLKTIQVKGMERETVQIEYRDGVKVYVRLDQFDRLQKYQGTESSPPVLSKIGGKDWSRARSKAEAAVLEMAKEIVELYARRKVEGGKAFSDDTRWQREMEAAFDFEDTPDQARAAEEIKRDMEKPVAMDRLLCGDVGFGKTEVAIRAAFKAVQDSTQVAVLVPTTILAQQHFETFTERMRRYPIRIEVLSRFRSRKEQKSTLEGLITGKVDIVIGTHRLISKDVAFKNLGLLIIDEEHRFGVKHKQRIKQLRATVDVLTMSATPIPRTLHKALSGAKDMSMISTPPHDRLPIQTEIAPADDRVIREAIVREIARGGQVYFLHNRVQTIDAIKTQIKKLVPGIKVGIAHGQMREGELEKVMHEFLMGEHQVLLCTMIIESGLDIPNVNTLIVNRADKLGLAQLYQVRGRIGRSHRQAYAYMLTPPRMLLQPDARKRLETLAENTRLGSGFQIAMRDLEIRGAGNILGAQQSGHINSVGFELYTEMLADAVKQLSEERETELPALKAGPHVKDVKIDVKVDAVLPEDYISDAVERVELYRRLSHAETRSEIRELREELVDRFGTLPRAGNNLLHMVETRILAADVGVLKVDIFDDAAFFQFEDDWGGEHFPIYVAQIAELTNDYPLELKGAGALGLKLSLQECKTWDERWTLLQELLERLPQPNTHGD